MSFPISAPLTTTAYRQEPLRHSHNPGGGRSTRGPAETEKACSRKEGGAATLSSLCPPPGWHNTALRRPSSPAAPQPKKQAQEGHAATPPAAREAPRDSHAGFVSPGSLEECRTWSLGIRERPRRQAGVARTPQILGAVFLLAAQRSRPAAQLIFVAGPVALSVRAWFGPTSPTAWNLLCSTPSLEKQIQSN